MIIKKIYEKKFVSIENKFRRNGNINIYVKN